MLTALPKAYGQPLNKSFGVRAAQPSRNALQDSSRRPDLQHVSVITPEASSPLFSRRPALCSTVLPRSCLLARSALQANPLGSTEPLVGIACTAAVTLLVLDKRSGKRVPVACDGWNPMNLFAFLGPDAPFPHLVFTVIVLSHGGSGQHG